MSCVASSGWQSSWRKEEERSRVTTELAEERTSSRRTTGLPGLALGDRWGKERENGEGVSGEEGAGPGLKHGKVAARAPQVAASAAKPSHAARTASTVTVMALFRKFKFSILPQTYH